MVYGCDGAGDVRSWCGSLDDGDGVVSLALSSLGVRSRGSWIRVRNVAGGRM